LRTRVKICCIASPEEAWTAISAGADALGLVSRMPSGGNDIPDADIARIAATTPPPVATFLLTAESTADAISAHIRATRPSVVQIVSPIDPAQSARLAGLEPYIRRVQVIHVESEDALNLILLYAQHVHAFLLDTGRPGAKIPEPGGTGRVHDWDISACFVDASPLPVFLAGGLTPANGGDAIRRARPFGLDLYSGVRTAGQLDPGKLAAFMRAVRDADLSLDEAISPRARKSD
jgi:phosphoribosylanthranilate isomerase